MMGDEDTSRRDVWHIPLCAGRLGQGILLALALVLLALAAKVPWYTRPREKARQTTCLANMKSLALCTLTYAHDWDDHLPPVPRHAKPSGPVDGWIRSTDLSKYFPPDDWHRQIHYINDQVFICPSTRNVYSYDFNASLYGVRLKGLQSPAETLLEFEAGFLTGSPPGPHLNGYNTTYCDGHGAWRPGKGYLTGKSADASEKRG